MCSTSSPLAPTQASQLKGLPRLACRIAAAIAVALSVTPRAHAQNAPIWKLPEAGNQSAPGLQQLVVVTPNTGFRTVANQLAALPPGSRGIVLSGFDIDLTTKDYITTKKRRATTSVKSPWIDKGQTAVRARVLAWMKKFAQYGGVVDFVYVSSNASLQSSNFSALSASAWQTIEADPRATQLSAALGTASLASDMLGNAQVRSSWDRYFTSVVDRSLDSAVASVVKAYFPSAVVVGNGRYTLQAEGGLLRARNGASFGTHDQPQMYKSGQGSDPIAVLGAIADDARALRFATGRASVPSVASPSWGGSEADLSSGQLWGEQFYHLFLAGASSVVLDKGVLSAQHASQLSNIKQEIQVKFAGSAAQPIQLQASYDHSAFVVSAALVGSRMLARISFPPGTGTATVQFDDGSSVVIQPGAFECGAWVEYQQNQQMAFVQLGGAGGSGSGLPEPVILFDTRPTADFNAPDDAAQQFLVVYEDFDVSSTWAPGTIDSQWVVAEVARLIALRGVPEYGMLDFEDPFDAVFAAGPSDPLYNTCIQALVDTIRAVKAAYPGIKWTYYAFPRQVYWLGGADWGSAGLTDEQREALYDAAANVVGPVLDEMDWVSPSIYDTYSRAQNAPQAWSTPIAAEVEYRKACVRTVQRYFESHSRPVPPIIPIGSPWYMDDNYALKWGPIPMDEFYEEQVLPSLEAGAAGIAIWGGMDYRLEVVSPTGPLPMTPYTVLVQNQARAAWAATYLGGVDPASVDWLDPVVRASLADHLNSTQSDSILQIRAAWTQLLGP